MSKSVEAEIKKITELAEAAFEKAKDQVAELANNAGILAYWGEYGNGETFYPEGTDINEHYLGWEGSQYADENGILTHGVWIASSSLC